MSTPYNQKIDPLSYDSFLKDYSSGTAKQFGVTSPGNVYGASRPGHIHAGIDIPLDDGTPLGAASDGEVLFAGSQKGYGNVVKLRHPDGMMSVYAHLQKINVMQGDRIKQGVPIGLSGETGNAKGPHVHYEIRGADGAAINPLQQEMFPIIQGKTYDPLSGDAFERQQSQEEDPYSFEAFQREQLKTPKVTSEAIEFDPNDPSYRERAPENLPPLQFQQGQEHLGTLMDYLTSESNRDKSQESIFRSLVTKLGNPIRPDFQGFPESPNDLIDALARKMGPQAYAANVNYRAETGRNLITPSTLHPTDANGGYEFYPTENLYRAINAYNNPTKSGSVQYTPMQSLLVEYESMKREKMNEIAKEQAVYEAMRKESSEPGVAADIISHLGHPTPWAGPPSQADREAAAEGLSKLGSDLGIVAANIATMAGSKSAPELARTGRIIQQGVAQTEQEKAAAGEGLEPKVIRGLTTAVPEAGLYLAASQIPVLGHTLLPVLGAISNYDKGKLEMLKGAGEGAAVQFGFHATGVGLANVGIGRLGNGLVWTTIPTMQGVVQGEDPLKSLIQSIPIGVLAAASAPVKVEGPQGVRLATPDDIAGIQSGELKMQPPHPQDIEKSAGVMKDYSESELGRAAQSAAALVPKGVTEEPSTSQVERRSPDRLSDDEYRAAIADSLARKNARVAAASEVPTSQPSEGVSTLPQVEPPPLRTGEEGFLNIGDIFSAIHGTSKEFQDVADRLSELSFLGADLIRRGDANITSKGGVSTPDFAKFSTELMKGVTDPNTAESVRPFLTELYQMSREAVSPRGNDVAALHDAQANQMIGLKDWVSQIYHPAQHPLTEIVKTPARVIASLMEMPKGVLLQQGADMVLKRSIFLAKRQFAIESFVRQMKLSVPEEDRAIEKMGYVLQGTKTADDVGLSPQGRDAIKDIQRFNEDQDKLLKAAYGDEVELQPAETYLAQMWKLGESDPRVKQAARLLMRDPFMRHKGIVSYEEGIAKGMTPLYSDIADVIRARADFASRAIGNQMLANDLNSTGMIMDATTARKLGLDQSWTLAPDATQLARAAYAGKTEGGDPIFSKPPVYVNPEVFPAVNAVFSQPFRGDFFQALDMIRATAKKFILSMSFFHHIALSEQAIAITTGEAGSKFTQGRVAYGFRQLGDLYRNQFFSNPDFYRGARDAIVELYPSTSKVLGEKGDPPAFRWKNAAEVPRMLDAGVSLDTSDHEAAVTSRLRQMGLQRGTLGQILTVPFRALGNLAYIWDKPLWDYFHQGQIIEGFYNITQNEIMKLDPSERSDPAKLAAIDRAAASHLNDAFGTVNFERLLISPKGQQALNFLLLAPQWTISNLRIAGKVLSDIPSRVADKVGGTSYTSDLSKREGGLSRRWAAGAAFSWFFTTQLLNYAFSSYYQTEDKHGRKGGHFSWDNPGEPLTIAGKRIPNLSNNAMNISTGYLKNPDGSEGAQAYMRFGRAYREPFLWLLDPLHTLEGKMSQPLKTTFVAATGYEPGSSYQIVNPDATPKEKALEFGGYVGKQFTPIGFGGIVPWAQRKLMPETFRAGAPAEQFLSQPESSGLTLHKAILSYQQFRDAGDDAAIDQLRQAADANHIRWNLVERAYRRREFLQRRNLKSNEVEP